MTTLVEIRAGGIWHDVTSRVRRAKGIYLSGGRRTPLRRTDSMKLTLSLGNQDGMFNPLNLASPFHGLIGRNTQIRWSEDGDIRFVGTVERWPTETDRWGKDAWVNVVAYGALRLVAGSGSKAPPRSALYRATLAAPGLTNHIPMEDGADATLLGNTAAPGDPATLSGATVGRVAGAPGSAGAARITVPTLTFTDNLSLPFASYTSQGATLITMPFRHSLDDQPEGTVTSTVEWHGTTSEGHTIQIGWQTGNGILCQVNGFTVTHTAEATDGEWHTLQLLITDDGSEVVIALLYDGVQVDTETSVSLVPFGTVDDLFVYLVSNVDGSATHVDGDAVFDVCHVSVHAVALADLDAALPYFTGLHDALYGYSGETVGERLARLSGEAGVALRMIGSALTRLGPQPAATTLDLFFGTVDVDMGILGEARDALELEYRAHESLYDQAPLILDYAAERELIALAPITDTETVQNDVTVQRTDGGFSRAVQATGPLNTSMPEDDPEGVGPYPVRITLPLETDSQTYEHADWRLFVGTIDQPRYTVGVSLSGLAARGKGILAALLRAVRQGDRIVISNPPPWAEFSPDQLVQGFVESNTMVAAHRIDFVTAPAAAYNDIFMLDDEQHGLLDADNRLGRG